MCINAQIGETSTKALVACDVGEGLEARLPCEGPTLVDYTIDIIVGGLAVPFAVSRRLPSDAASKKDAM